MKHGEYAEVVTVDVAVTTADELFALSDDGMRHELVAGVHQVMSPSGARHGRRSARLARLLDEHATAIGGAAFGAETGFVLTVDPDTVRVPDAAFVTVDRLDAIGDTERFWPEAPSFVAEVVSPSDTFREVEANALEWLEAGTVLVLVIDPGRRTATVYHGPGEARIHRQDDTLDLDAAVPGWRPKVADLFG
jgi:Uma2 family endonuclease